MVNVSKRCGHPSCNKRPSYGMGGSKTAEVCSKHKKEGMVDIRKKRCGCPGCINQPSYGTEGGKTAEFCARHAKVGMASIKRKRCGHPVAATSSRRTAWKAARQRSSAPDTQRREW